MINHIVAWDLLNDLDKDEKAEAKLKIKFLLEPLKDKISGIHSLSVETELLGSSNKDVVLISSFYSREDLEAYQIHPDHVHAGSYIKSVTCNRVCIDYEN